MVNHTDTPAIIRYLKNTAEELVIPIEQACNAMLQEGQDEIDGWSMISMSLLQITIQFTHVDEDFSDNEVYFLYNIIHNFFPDLDSPDFNEKQIREFVRQTINNNPQFYNNFESSVGVVSILNIYDNLYDTDYADKAKAMFFQFANAVAKADGKVTKDEKLLLKILVTLYPIEAKGGS